MPDLIAIPGFAELQAITRGDSRIKIAVLDGLPTSIALALWAQI